MLQGRMAVGAVTYEEADRIWKEVEEKQFTLEEQLGRAEKLGEELNRPLNALVCQISIPIQKESGTPALCLFERRAIIVSDALTDSLTNHHLADALDMTAFAAVPLIAKGEFVGTLVVDNRFLPKETINEEDVRVLETFASEAAMIIENVRLRDQLLEQRKLEAWKQFAARAAHRVGTQLSIIREALTETPSGTMVDSQSLNEGIERMKRVLEELKQFARPREPHFEILDLNKIIQQVRDRSPEELNFALALNLAPDLPLLEGDAQAIFDTFVELLRNATDAIPKDGSGKITITTTFLPSGSPDPTREGQLVYTSHICVEFVDNGPGVLPKDKDAIFHPFHSLKAKSSGLGLAIAKEEIEEIHHGVIREVGTYGQGARFVILLPLTQPKGG
jgi:signal transduction histidine kinase